MKTLIQFLGKSNPFVIRVYIIQNLIFFTVPPIFLLIIMMLRVTFAALPYPLGKEKKMKQCIDFSGDKGVGIYEIWIFLKVVLRLLHLLHLRQI